jgi:hypothetical protein
MTDEQARLLLSLDRDEARLLMDSGECALYRRIQRRMVKLVREYDVQLPLNCLQFFYHVNGYSRKPDRRSRQEAPF